MRNLKRIKDNIKFEIDKFTNDILESIKVKLLSREAKKMTKKLNKPSKIFLVDTELMLHDLLVDIMERYGYDIEQAKELIFGLVEIQADEIQEEAEANENNA